MSLSKPNSIGWTTTWRIIVALVVLVAIGLILVRTGFWLNPTNQPVTPKINPPVTKKIDPPVVEDPYPMLTFSDFEFGFDVKSEDKITLGKTHTIQVKSHDGMALLGATAVPF